jgi:hypothetical protein
LPKSDGQQAYLDRNALFKRFCQHRIARAAVYEHAVVDKERRNPNDNKSRSFPAPFAIGILIANNPVEAALLTRKCRTGISPGR